jgi:hypothetical protein
VATRTSGSAGGQGKRSGSKDRYRAPGLPNHEDPKVCLLIVIGVREDGCKELLAVEDGYRESTESWAFSSAAA